jgi:hypothetical protein
LLGGGQGFKVSLKEDMRYFLDAAQAEAVGLAVGG